MLMPAGTGRASRRAESIPEIRRTSPGQASRAARTVDLCRSHECRTLQDETPAEAYGTRQMLSGGHRDSCADAELRRRAETVPAASSAQGQRMRHPHLNLLLAPCARGAGK